MPKTRSVKFRDHFKVDVHVKDTPVFENELIEKGLDFYVDYNRESSSDSSVQYFILHKDKAAIENFLRENKISMNSETIQYVAFGEERKFISLYLKLVGLFIVLMLLLKTVDLFLKP